MYSRSNEVSKEKNIKNIHNVREAVHLLRTARAALREKGNKSFSPAARGEFDVGIPTRV